MAVRTVSHYEVLEKLGEGGMGVVFLARDMDLGRLVALKFLPPQVVDSPDEITRFRQEARAISALNHPHIATIHGIEEAGENKFLVLEYLPGGTLRQRLEEWKLRGERPPLRQAINWTIQIAEGLEHAHRRGIIHRDIKASNILFTEDGLIKIADFGLAKFAKGGQEGLTEAGIAVGTPPCMSPEQAQGLEVDERSDMFSLGIVLFESIAGKAPFHGAHTAALLHEIIYAPAPSLNRFRGDVPEALQAIVSKALEKSPESRYQTMGDFLTALRALGVSESPARAASIESTATITSVAPPRLGYRWKVAAAAVLAAGTIVAAIPDVRHQASNWFHARPLPAEKRIAVLEFRNIGDDPLNQALTEGLMEVVSNSLTRMEGGALLVVPATDVRKDHVASTGDALRKMGANLAITGSVLRNGDSVQVMINLVDTRNHTQLRSEAVKTGLGDAALSDRVVNKVAAMFETAVQAQDPRAVKTQETHAAGAERYYVEGVGDLRLNDRPETIDSAIGAFRRAIAIDGNYVLAYVGLAEAQWRRYSVLRDPDSMAAALESCQTALRLNDRLAPVHVTAAMVQAGSGHYDEAIREFRKALAIDPRNADAYSELATAYAAMGRLDLAEATYKKTVQLRPEAWWTLKQIGVFYFSHGRYPEAERYFLKVTHLLPNSAKAFSNLGAVYVKMGRKEDALAQFRNSISIEPVASACNNLGYLYFMDGRYEEAAAQFEKATELINTDSAFWGNLGDAYRWTSLAAKAPGAYHRAVDLLQKEVSVNPVDAQLHSRLAMTWASLGALDPDPAARQRARQNAASEIARAIRLSPADGTVQFQASVVFEQAGQRDKALGAIKASVKAGPDHLEEIRKAPPLAELRNDPRFPGLLNAH